MPPPLTPFRTCVFRARPRGAVVPPLRPSTIAIRHVTEKNNPDKLPQAKEGESGPNTQQGEHVSEEAAKMAKMQGGEGPDMSVGTPVQEILESEPAQREQAPQVVKEEAQTNTASTPTPDTNPSGTRRFSTLARRQLPELQSMSSSPSDLPPSMLSSTPPTIYNSQTSKYLTSEGVKTGHKFPLPDISTVPTKSTTSQKSRNHAFRTQTTPILTQLTNLLMRDGKKPVAETNMSLILGYLRTLPAPTLSTARPILTHGIPAIHLPLNPILYLTTAVDSIAPLMRIRSQRGAAGGGVALQIPVPLGLRQRRRTAFTWILDAASKRPNRGSGKEMFAQRVANEIVGVVEGRSAIWDKRQAVHRLATAARTNVGWGKLGGRR